LKRLSMASKNRAALINKVLKVVKKHFKPSVVPKDRTLLEHLLFACCLENSPYEAAERAFQTLKSDYFDWNEVRVSTVRELAEALKPLNDPGEAATRVKRILQSVFETHYSFDVEQLKKQNIGAAVKHLEKFNGSTPFVVAFVTQHALGGHAIPVNAGLMESMRIVGVVSDAEAAKGVVPGLERTVPKSKGSEVGSQLHLLGVEMHRSPYGPAIRKLLLEIEPGCKDNLPKRPTKAEEAADGVAAMAPPKPTEAAGKKAPTKKPAAEPAPAAKGKPAKKPEKPVKKVLKKKAKPAAVASAGKKLSANKRLTKRKPR
jgi:endonuclease III